MLRVLGPIAVDGPDGTHHSLSRVHRHLLAVLVAAGPSGLPIDSVANELWGDTLPTSWSASLRNHLSRLRIMLAPAEVPTRGGVCRLDLAPADVDAWLLLAPRTATEWTDDLVWLLEPTVPYEGVDPSDRLAQSTNQILAARRRVLDAFVTEQHGPVSVAIRDVMRSSALADPFDEHLTTLSATADANAGERARAMATVETNSAILRHELGNAACRSLDEFADSLAARRLPTTSRSAQPADLARRFPEQLTVAASEAAVRRDAQLGNAVEWLRAATSTRHLAIEGDWAAGKSRFLARVARVLFDGGAAVRFVNASPSSLAYEDALAALPELRPALETLAERLAEHHGPTHTGVDDHSTTYAIHQTVLWSRAADLVERSVSDRPLVLVVDDAEHLDTPSAQLLGFLVRGSSVRNLTLLTASLRGQTPAVLAGTDGHNRSTIVLEPLDLEAVTQSVKLAFPTASAAAVAPLAEAALHLSGGLPSLLHAVFDATDPVTFEPPSSLGSPDDVVTSLLNGLHDQDVLVGSAVSVLGQGVSESARLSAIATVSGHTIDETLESLDRLTDRGLLIDGPRFDAYRVQHSPAALAFKNAVTRSQLRTMHASAVASATSSHARAHHLLAAAPAFDEAVVLAALEASAQDHLRHGSVSNALSDLRTADKLADGSLGAVARGQMAVCLSRVGQHDEADTARAAAFALAAEVDDWELALDLVLAGQHDDTARYGQPERLGLLERIPSDRLGPRSRGQRAIALSILAADIGDRPCSERYLAEAHESTDPLDRHELARAEHFVNVFAHPTDRLDRIRAALTSSASSLTDDQQLVASQLEMAELYVLGQTERAVEALEVFEHLGVKLESVRAQWHAGLVRSMLSMANDDRVEAERRSSEAHALGRRFALVGADEARLAQLFFAHWIDGTHGSLLPKLLQVPGALAHGPVQSAIASALMGAGRVDEAIERTRPPVATMESWRHSLGPTMAASLVDIAVAARDRGDRSIANEISRVLQPLSGTIVILGTGVIDRGPADVSLARLLPEGSAERSVLLDAAAELAQRSGSVLWQKRIISLR